VRVSSERGLITPLLLLHRDYPLPSGTSGCPPLPGKGSPDVLALGEGLEGNTLLLVVTRFPEDFFLPLTLHFLVIPSNGMHDARSIPALPSHPFQLSTDLGPVCGSPFRQRMALSRGVSPRHTSLFYFCRSIALPLDLPLRIYPVYLLPVNSL